MHNAAPIKAIYSSTNIYHLNYCTFHELSDTASRVTSVRHTTTYLHDVIAFTYNLNRLLYATVRQAFLLTFAQLTRVEKAELIEPLESFDYSPL